MTKGDLGTTRLYSGNRLSKTSIYFHISGDIDELNGYMGLIRYSFSNNPSCAKYDTRFLLGIQENLIGIDRILLEGEKRQFGNDEVVMMDKEILSIKGQIPSMKEFDFRGNIEKNIVLPGTTGLEPIVIIARSICRRIERRLHELNHNHPVDSDLLVYINRLSDYLYILARYDVHLAYSKPTIYKKNKVTKIPDEKEDESPKPRPRSKTPSSVSKVSRRTNNNEFIDSILGGIKKDPVVIRKSSIKSNLSN